jgi:hypothetical protein
MQLTEEQLERAARELLNIQKIDPENKYYERWVADAAMDIKEFLQIQEAVNRVVKKKDPDQYLADLKRSGEIINRTSEGLKPI